uniref:Small RNA 2'-O-methyltransferase n=1 Tax=Neogobius melanostomus TaxID=47308 RepID=A0A8C6UWF8_9GOBI
MEPFFNPPLHKQRHQFVIDFIKKNKTKKVVDLGCCECTLLKKLKFHREIEHLVGVDIDEATVKRKMHSLAPISTDYLQPGYEQLCVEMYQGSVTERDARLRGFDLALSIELIEHLPVPDVERFSEVLFGYMAPVHAIISTPNSDFNPLLPGLRGFRHPDHKFEWTRQEFQSWAEKVCADFGYEVDITGVGKAPDGGQEQFGFCSQIAVFHQLTSGCNMFDQSQGQGETSYTLLYSVNYPTLRDNNVLRRVLVSEVLFWAESMKRRWTEAKHTEERGEGLMTKHSAACGEGSPTEDQRRSASHSGEESDVWCTNRRTRYQSGATRSVQSVPVPLFLLWVSCPRVSSLCGSLSNLRQYLTDEPLVRLSPDGYALLLEQEADEEELFDEDPDDSGYAEVGLNQTLTSVALENWEED